MLSVKRCESCGVFLSDFFEHDCRPAPLKGGDSQRLKILRSALEAIYGTPELTLGEARAIAHAALELVA